jgi:hypothetical protein
MGNVARCALCENVDELKLSHIIPKFVFRYLKKDSFTGRMRNVSNPNQAVQDGDKMYLLCGKCEELFSQRETPFSNKIFHPFKANGFNGLSYDGNWLQYFIVSVNWRTLYLDLKGFVENSDKENGIDEKDLKLLIKTEKVMRDYLLGFRSDLSSIENHIFFFDDIKSIDSSAEINNPHRLIQGSAFSYTVLIKDPKCIYVFANLTGVIIVTIIKRATDEKWKNTYVKQMDGKIRVPQQVKSPIFSELFYIQDQREKYLNKMSEKQKQQIIDKVIDAGESFKESGSYKRFLKDQKIEYK